MPSVLNRHVPRLLCASGAMLMSGPALSSVDFLHSSDDSEQRIAEVEFARWLASPAGNRFEVSTGELRQQNGFRWSLDQPLNVFADHSLGDHVRIEAHTGLVPNPDAWAGFLTSDTANNAALFGLEASLALVTEFGPRRVSPWRLALGGGWGEADQAFARAIDQNFRTDTEGSSDGEAMIWLRLSRDF